MTDTTTSYDIDHRPYTPAELDAIRRRTPAEVQAIRDAGDAGEHGRADLLGCIAMRAAAYYLQRGAVEEAHDLLRQAAQAWHEGRFGVGEGLAPTTFADVHATSNDDTPDHIPTGQ